MSSHQTRSQFQQHHGGATLSNTLQGDSVAETFGNIVAAGQQSDLHHVTYSSQTVDQTRNFQPIPLLQTTGTFHTAESTLDFDDNGDDIPNAQQLPHESTQQESTETDSEHSGDTHILEPVVTGGNEAFETIRSLPPPPPEEEDHSDWIQGVEEAETTSDHLFSALAIAQGTSVQDLVNAPFIHEAIATARNLDAALYARILVLVTAFNIQEVVNAIQYARYFQPVQSRLPRFMCMVQSIEIAHASHNHKCIKPFVFACLQDIRVACGVITFKQYFRELTPKQKRTAVQWCLDNAPPVYEDWTEKQVIPDDQATETYLDDSLDDLLRVPSNQDIAGDFAYGASFQRHTGEVQGLITDLCDELHAQTDAWSEQLQQIPEIQAQGTNQPSPE